MKRTAIRRKTPLKRVSTKRASELARYFKLRKKYLQEFPVCEICKSRESVDIHHMKLRIGDRLNQTFLWIAVCREDHRKIHDNPLWAKKMGYLL